MPQVKNLLEIKMQPTLPEVLSVLSAVLAFHPGQEVEFLTAIISSSERRIEELKKTVVKSAE